MKRILVVGGGAAGMAAAIAASSFDTEVNLFERNEKLGKKLFITGKGRCNVTNDCTDEVFFESVIKNSRFLYSSYSRFRAADTMEFFRNAGVSLKVERGNRVFPVSDHSSDIIRALEKEMSRRGIKIHLNTGIASLIAENGEIRGVITDKGDHVLCDRCIIATGGCSYPQTGSRGDGYRFATETGHKVTETIPSLVPMETKEAWVRDLMGLSLRNVSLTIKNGKKELYSGFGEMLFTHFGVSGPLILTASSKVGDKLRKQPLSAFIDLKPALTEEQLDARLLREFRENSNKDFINAVSPLFPGKLVPVMVMLSGISPHKKTNEVTKGERRNFVSLIKHLPFTIVGTRGFSEAIVTRGGVSVRQVDPSTMESKLVKGLYFAGEVLDIDAVTGGFNLQVAWTTGFAAGEAASKGGNPNV